MKLREAATERRGRWVLASLLTLAGTAVAVHAVPAWHSLMQFDRERIAGGEFWRLVTGHFAHWSWDHLLWDVVAFGLLSLLAVRLAPRRAFRMLAVAAPVIGGAIWWLAPEIRLYRGLSGLDAALFTLVAAGLLRRGRLSAVVGGFALALFLAKVGWEVSTGGALFVQAEGGGFVTVTLAHLVGAGVGFVFGILPAKRGPGLAQRAAETRKGLPSVSLRRPRGLPTTTLRRYLASVPALCTWLTSVINQMARTPSAIPRTMCSPDRHWPIRPRTIPMTEARASNAAAILGGTVDSGGGSG
ncbi:MAG: rhombosortase [Acidobacteriota bacterium]